MTSYSRHRCVLEIKWLYRPEKRILKEEGNKLVINDKPIEDIKYYKKAI